jgi:hypothetical protein
LKVAIAYEIGPKIITAISRVPAISGSWGHNQTNEAGGTGVMLYQNRMKRLKQDFFSPRF